MFCNYMMKSCAAAAAAAAKSLQSCPILCDPIDGSPPGFPVSGILQARTLEWVAISFSKVTYTPIQNTNYQEWMSTLFPSGLGGLGCCHILEAWAGLVPKDRLSRGWWSWGGRASRWALPHGPGEPLPLTASRCRHVLLQWNYATASKGCATSGLEELWKALWAPCLLVLEFPPPASFLRVAPPMDEITLPRVVLQELGFVQVTGLRKEEGMGHKL